MDAARGIAVGVDIGGTKVAAGLVNAEGRIVFQTRVPMPVRGSASDGFGAVQSAIESVFAARPDVRRELTEIGICAPGPLDPLTGVILNPPNVPCWRNFPLAEEVKRTFALSALVDNDGNAAALAEAIWGAGVGYRNVFYATLGTGIGTGIVLDGKIYHGRTGSAAEGGHLSIDYRGPVCGCGKRGCIEALCSGPAIARRAKEHLAGWQPSESQPRESKILALAGGSADSVTMEIVAEAFRAGDPLAHELLRETADLLAIWVGNVIDLLEPDVFIFGGGLAELMSGFFGRMREQLPMWCVNQRVLEMPMVLAKYGPDAGIAGAAALCRQL
ncbi:MAG: ROK family protein [Candidatus Acidiferrum sp.]